MDLRPSIATVFTPLPPACLQFAPSDPSLLVVGTYHLDTSASTLESKKTGALHLYRATPSSLTLLHTVSTPAVLDLKFSPHNPSLLAAGTALGKVLLFTLDAAEERLVEIAAFASADECEGGDSETLVTALTWNPVREGELAFTLSSGAVGVVDVGEGRGKVREMARVHELEAWTCEFAPDGARLFSGGDDAVLAWYDFREGTEQGRNRKVHGAGVTAILAEAGGEKVLTGSYDEVLRSWDLRMGMMRVGDQELGLDGGVWRLQRLSSDKLLASCMHAGTRLVNTDDWNVVAKFEENESMNYGSHVHPMQPDIVASCSFYDKRLCLWSI
ncbi:WD40-repeat-containing domain protein [Geopyxis carbonaria]|nr:WD40-repeat-containing domain protein [Geopyxis carbonaria]